MTLLTVRALTALPDPQLPATASNMCTTDDDDILKIIEMGRGAFNVMSKTKTERERHISICMKTKNIYIKAHVWSTLCLRM